MIGRRGFLKGLGAAVAAVTLGATLVTQPETITIQSYELFVNGERIKLDIKMTREHWDAAGKEQGAVVMLDIGKINCWVSGTPALAALRSRG